MTEVPKIVYDRLQAGLPQSQFGESHPDADLLTAFAELAISAPERDHVLQHLASCGDCRDVVALALPAVEIGETSVASEDENDVVGAPTRAAKSSRGWLSSFTFAAPTLRWAAMAASVAVVASVLLLRPGLLNHGTIPSANSQIAKATPADLSGQIAISRKPSPESTPPAALAKTERPSPTLQTSKKFDPQFKANATSAADLEVLMAENNVAPEAKDLDRATSTLNARRDALSIEKAKPASPANEAEAYLATANQSTKTESSLSNSPAMDTLPSATGASSAGRLRTGLAHASPSPTDLLPAHIATFTIAGGILQRSLDNGQSWQNALHADHSLLCYASSGHNIWTGGEAGALFHSADDGVTWSRVQASVGAQTLGSDIAHIDLSSTDLSNTDLFNTDLSNTDTTSHDGCLRATVVVSTRNQEVWSSADGGKTWQKK